MQNVQCKRQNVECVFVQFYILNSADILHWLKALCYKIIIQFVSWRGYGFLGNRKIRESGFTEEG